MPCDHSLTTDSDNTSTICQKAPKDAQTELTHVGMSAFRVQAARNG